MTLIANKIAEVYDNMVANNQPAAVWRGLLDGEDWKIGIDTRNDPSANLVMITAKKRNNGV
jgi:hypothetical protein